MRSADEIFADLDGMYQRPSGRPAVARRASAEPGVQRGMPRRPRRSAPAARPVRKVKDELLALADAVAVADDLAVGDLVALADSLGGRITDEAVTPAWAIWGRRWILRQDIVRSEFEANMQRRVDRMLPLSDAQVRGILNIAVTRARRESGAPAPARGAVEDGMYLHDGAVVRVQKAVHGSGQLYAKRLVPFTEGGVRRARFEYEQGLVRKLRPEERMSLEQALEYGALYGVCVRCGRTLTDETSIEAAMGPICRRAFS